jgi:hypothetical protein
MRVIVLLIALLLVPSVAAAPVITEVPPLQDNAVVTISGSGFGTKDPVKQSWRGIGRV